MTKIALPEDVKFIIDVITRAGYEAYAVGGCIRDTLLNREPEDWDIATSAAPWKVKELFHHTIDTGLKHGTVTVMMHRVGYEVTTYRIDGEYLDGRHPESVSFVTSLEEDLKRRDFTINAMAYNDRSGLVDLFGGQRDMEQGMIRCVGNAADRFREDALRMLRALRFSAQLGYQIHPFTQDAISKMAVNLRKVSAERIQTEFLKLLLSPHPEYLQRMYELGLTAQFLPEFDRMMETEQNNPHHCYTVGIHTIRVMQGAPSDRVLRLAALFHDVGKPDCKWTDGDGTDHFAGHAQEGCNMTEQIMRRLKFDNDTIRQVCCLVLYHDMGNDAEITPEFTRYLMHDVGPELFSKLLTLKEADVAAQSAYMQEEKAENHRRMRLYYEEALRKAYCIDLKHLALKGRDLMEAGMRPGTQMGEALERLLNEVLSHPERNQKDILLEKLRAWGYI
ncbi:MAG: CCA tRNA nucleotidyltransferase [Lachnospiraceae bacterium]|nr:CCA tRNA nucleotidyltransferase [Lachnospiraceae bacterium]